MKPILSKSGSVPFCSGPGQEGPSGPKVPRRGPENQIRSRPGFARDTFLFSFCHVASHASLVCPAGAIPDGEVLTEMLPCWRCHPGLCADKDRDIWLPGLDVAAKSLVNSALAGVFSVGDFLALQAMTSEGELLHSFVCVAYIRKAGPSMVVLAKCSRVLHEIKLDLSEDQFHFIHHAALVGDFFRRAVRGGSPWLSPSTTVT